MKNLYERYKAFMVEVVLRRILIPGMLTLAYVFGVGPSSLFARLFLRRRLVTSRIDDESFWKSASGNEPDRAKCLRQS